MTKKFDVVIGNPPYQEEAQGEGTRETPIYHRFMDAAYEVGAKAVLITPARFLFDGGLTPKAWNEKTLTDEHLKVAYYESDSNLLFPSLADPIKGGIVVTYRDSERKVGPIGFFAKHAEVSTILRKVEESGNAFIESVGITSSRSYRYTTRLYEDHPEALAMRPVGNAALVNTNAFEVFSFLYHAEKPNDGNEYVRVLGVVKNRRSFRWLRRDYITGPPSFLAYKVAVPKANGSGSTTDFFGIPLNKPTVLEPGITVTQTFITIGTFETEAEAQACLKFLKSKFARTMLGILKITPDNPRSTWKYLPADDFTSTSDIDWTKTVSEIDAQLYAKYGLDPDEIAFIEAKVKPMN